MIPFAFKPAKTNAAAARKSVAYTSAPCNSWFPSMIATFPSILTWAFIRRISSKCWKRFSNTVSVTTLVPSATNWIAVIWACISVGKPGWGIVFTSVGKICFGPMTRTPPSSSMISAPISINLEINGRLCSEIASAISTLPCVIAAATIKVPASIRSCTIEWLTACKWSTPSIRIVSVPAP